MLPFFGLWNTKKVNFKYNILFFIVFIFSAVRFDAGYNYESYYKIILGIKDVKFEPISMFFVELSRNTDFTQLFCIITSFIIAYSIYYVLIYYSKDYLVPLLIFKGVENLKDNE